ncbi:MAG: SDR family NAD(P)-dependent oxidoreductase [Thermoanaerobaculia bacterium]|nr:SDR family NAD(P)-dependent oxidoreductase [Thermoanaerobaculia bacterium]
MTELKYTDRTGFEVAVIGMAGRFPGARNVREYWANLCAGKETLTRYTREQLVGHVPQSAIDDPNYVAVIPALGDSDMFDAAFFNFSPREAEIVDPQSRVLLESAWEAMEDAGYDPESYPGLIGIWAGGRLSMYLAQLYRNPEVMRTMGDFQVQIGCDKDYIATRIAYKLNLGGPAVTVQTACSTALVAVHSACQSLISGEIDLALAGGVAARAPEAHGYPYKEGEVYSKAGRVRPFDAGADGTIFGSGSGIVVLKRLEDAERDRDQIYAVIKGSATSNDGARKVGFTAPGADGQRRVVRAAQLAAEIDPDTISYIEAHGTGTNLGDPIEVDALTKAFRESTDRTGFCRLGSVKGNVGHLSAAAGVAGLIKLSMALKHKQIPASLWFEKPNPQIDFASSPFVVNTELTDWQPPAGLSRRAGLSAFGIGGTNAHVVVEEAPPAPPSGPSRPWQLLPFSARTSTALDAMGANLGTYFAAENDLQLADAAFTLARGRRVFEHRRFALVRDKADAVAVLGGGEPARLLSGTPESQDRSVTFLFTGQGSQYAGMGRGLYENEPVFRAEVDQACELLRPHLGRDLRELLFPAPEGMDAANHELEQTALTQPALFVIEYALAKLWQSWGIEPAAMLGHSIGEYVAATVAGVFQLEDALRLVSARGRLMQAQPPGDMLAVPLPEAEILPLLGPELSIAALNAPSRSVVSGPHEAVQAFAEKLTERGVACRPLHTSHAFHSGMMESMLGPFLEAFRGIQMAPPKVRFVSNLTGTWITDEQAMDPGYWAQHLRGAVRFSDGIQLIGREGLGLLLEVGPGNTLTSLARQNPGKGEGTMVLSSMRHPKDNLDDQAFLLENLGRMWLAGVKVDWAGYYANEDRRRVSLPSYPFEKRSYLVLADPAAADAAAGPAKKLELQDWFTLLYWKPSAVPTGTPEEAAAAAEGGWLLFDDGSSLGRTLGDWLTTSGKRVAWVAPGTSFEKSAPGRYVVGPDAEDYKRVLVDLDQQGFAPRQLVHLWNVGDGGSSSQDSSFYALLALAQGLGKRGGTKDVRLAVVTSGMQKVADEAVTHPERATVLGPVQVIPSEYGTVRTASVDVDLPLAGSPEEAELAMAVAAELTAGLPETWVAYREGERYLRGLEPTRLGEVDPVRLKVRDGGTYVITGGMGGFGLTFAEWLCRDHGANVVLLGRSPLPPREEWESLVADKPDDRTAKRVAKLLAIEALGGQVAVEAASVTDAESMRAALDRARARFGEIHGVIHAAGVAGGGLMQLKTREMAAAVLEPKIEGTLALAAAVGDAPLDFFVLCSSTIAILGCLGQVDYCAANNFMDAWARSRAGKRGGTYFVSINWGAWREVGMAVETLLPPGAAATMKPTAAAAEKEEEFTGPGLHPLIDRLIEDTPTRKIFAARVSPQRHWVLNEHRIAGTPAIPGTTYLEIVRAAFRVITNLDAPFEIRSLFFMQPVLVDFGKSREVQFHFEMEADGSAAFKVVSQNPGGDGLLEHARGIVARTGSERPAPLDLAAIGARCTQQDVTMAGDEMAKQEKLVYWGERWQLLRRIQIGDNEGLATLVLPERFVADLDEYALHPAMTDVATALGATLVAEGSYLPLAYRRMRAFAPLQPNVVSFIRVTRSANKETINIDITVVTPEGEVLFDVEGFTMKRVGAAAASLNTESQASRSAAAKPAEAPRSLFGADGMSPAEGVEALRRVLARGRQSQIGISQRELARLLQTARAATAKKVEQKGSDASASTSTSSHPRPNLATAYVAPRNEFETKLAGVWAAAIGIDRVGIHDNFFELGGDSILGIQVIARAGKVGITLAPEQLFEFQTVAELAAAVAESAGTSLEAEAVAATPYQVELLAGAGAAAVADLDPSGNGEIDPGLVRTALTEVVRRHPALDLRFESGEAGWSQAVKGNGELHIVELDLGSKTAAERDTAVAAIRRELLAGLSGGPVFGAALVRGAEVGEDRLLLAAAREVADEHSLELLARQVERAYGQLAAGGVVEVGAEGAPFTRWAERLPKWADEVADDLEFWLDVRRTQTGFLPAGGSGEGVGTERLALDAEDSASVLTEVTERFRVEPEEILLAAVADALSRSTGDGSFLIRLEVDGRSLFQDLDQAHTVGSFSLAFPQLVELPAAGAGVGDLLRETKEQRRSVPNGGASFAVLANLGTDVAARERLAAMPVPQVAVADWGTVERIRHRLPAGLELEIGLLKGADGTLSLVAHHDQSAIDGGTVVGLLESAAETMREWVQEARSGGDVAFSPTDFPEAGLSQDELDHVFSKLKGTVE